MDDVVGVDRPPSPPDASGPGSSRPPERAMTWMSTEQHRSARTDRPAAEHGGHLLLAVVMLLATAAVLVLVSRGPAPWAQLRMAIVAWVVATVLWFLRAAGTRTPLIASILVGISCAVIGAGFAPFAISGPIGPIGVAAIVAVTLGMVLVVAATAVAVRRRRRRVVVGWTVTIVAVVAVVAFVATPAIIATNPPHQPVGATPAAVGLAYESVTLTADDGIELAGWYMTSRNRAAVVVLHGSGSTRSNVLDQAAVIAKNGFGVLMIDARGHGDSAGDAMDFGWHGDDDLGAATRYLVSRADVDPRRIGAVGLSMGGEEAIGATATNRTLRAVVAEGAIGRVAADLGWLSDAYGWRGAVQERLEELQDVLTSALAATSPPRSLSSAISQSRDVQFLLITAGQRPDERHAADELAAAAPGRVAIWTVAGAGHTDGLGTNSTGWEQRVVRFLHRELLEAP
jgi:fermentation-respiration switch protein FrsA (DUF1100 family)